jgi:hypothetical protein
MSISASTQLAVEQLAKNAQSMLERLRTAVRDGKSPDEVAGLASLYSSLILMGERAAIMGGLEMAVENLKRVRPGEFGRGDAKQVYQVAYSQLEEIFRQLEANSIELAQVLKEAVTD